MTLQYLLSFLDRGNIGNAKIEGLAEDLHLTGAEYNWCLTGKPSLSLKIGEHESPVQSLRLGLPTSELPLLGESERLVHPSR